jgi:tetratricopeptide (TPR) repeat protein
MTREAELQSYTHADNLHQSGETARALEHFLKLAETAEDPMVGALASSRYAELRAELRDLGWKNDVQAHLGAASKIFFDCGYPDQLAQVLPLLGAILLEVSPSAGLRTLIDGMKRLQSLGYNEQAEYLNEELPKLCERAVLMARIEYAARPHDEHMSYELGSTLLLVGEAEEAVHFLKGALNTFKIMKDAEQGPRLAAHARWALAHALAYDQATQTEAQEMAEEALEYARAENEYLSWFPGPLGSSFPRISAVNDGFDFPKLNFPTELPKPYASLDYAARLGNYGSLLVQQQVGDSRTLMERAELCLRVSWDTFLALEENRHAARVAIFLLEARLKLDKKADVEELADHAIKHLVPGEDDDLLKYLGSLAQTYSGEIR